MGSFAALSAHIDRVNSKIGTLVSWLVLISILVSAGNALVRKTFNYSSNAWLEVQWYLFSAAFLLAAAHTLRHNEHIRVDIIYGKLSRRAQHWIDLLGHAFFLMPFVILMVVYLIPYVSLSYRTAEFSSNAGGLIIWPAKSLLLAGFLLLSLQGISEIIKKLMVINSPVEDSKSLPSSHALPEAERPAGGLGT